MLVAYIILAVLCIALVIRGIMIVAKNKTDSQGMKDKNYMKVRARGMVFIIIGIVLFLFCAMILENVRDLLKAFS